MSITSKAAAGFPAGAVQLFSADETPAGWERMSTWRLPDDVYESSPCLTLLNYDAAPGGARVSDLNSSAIVVDPTSAEHVFIAYTSTSLRRQHLLTGVGTMCAASPWSFGYSSPSGFVSTPHGLFVYAASAGGPVGVAVLKYSVVDNAWTNMSRLPSSTSYGGSFGAVYDSAHDCTYLVGGSGVGASTYFAHVFAHYLARNEFVTLPSLPAPAYVLASCMFEGLVLFVARSTGTAGTLAAGFYTYDPATGTCTQIEFEGAAPVLPTVRVHLTVHKGRVFMNGGSVGGGLAVLSRKPSGAWTFKQIAVAGLPGLNAQVGYPGLATPVLGNCTLSTTTTGLYLLNLEGLETAPTATYFYARKL